MGNRHREAWAASSMSLQEENCQRSSVAEDEYEAHRQHEHRGRHRDGFVRAVDEHVEGGGSMTERLYVEELMNGGLLHTTAALGAAASTHVSRRRKNVSQALLWRR